MNKFLTFLLILILFLTFIPTTKAEGASIYLSPSSGTFYVGSTFNVSVFVNTGGSDVNAVRVDLKFDPKKLQVASPTAGRSLISVWISQPAYSNVEGTVSFRGGVPSPGINTSSGLISTITFRVIAPGSATVSVLEASQVLLNDGMGTDILSWTGRGTYTLTMPPPEGPRVSSSTHPDQNKWYKNNSPTLGWERESWVTDFSYSVDKDYRGTPDNISEGDHAAVSHTDLEDGIWYFHIRAKKAGVWGGVSHYIVRVDTTPPAAFTLSFEPFLASPIPTSQPIVSFITTDALSGIDHYELKTVSLTETKEKKEADFWIEVTSPYKLAPLGAGTHKVMVRAFDSAGNWRDASEKLGIIPRGEFVVSKDGVNFWIVFLPWWLIILILVILILLILGFVFWWRKYHKRVHREREVLRETAERVKADGERIKGKLGGMRE